MDVHLVDGTYELFRCFYGAPARAGAAGQEVGATRALCGSLLTLLKDGATHVGVAFDTVIESFRNQLFAGYKTGDGIDPALHAQFPLAERATRALGLVTWSMIDFEADDALATMAARAAADARVQRVWLCSPDKDLGQCVVGERVVMVDRVRQKTLDAAAVREKFGVPPAGIPDLLALMGDDADGIPGLEGFGAKSAAALLARYGALESIPEGAWDVPVRGADRLRATLQARRAEAALYKRLATLRRDVPLAEGVDALAWKGPDEAALAALGLELADEGLVERARKVHARWRKQRGA